MPVFGSTESKPGLQEEDDLPLIENGRRDRRGVRHLLIERFPNDRASFRIERKDRLAGSAARDVEHASFQQRRGRIFPRDIPAREFLDQIMRPLRLARGGIESAHDQLRRGHINAGPIGRGSGARAIAALVLAARPNRRRLAYFATLSAENQSSLPVFASSATRLSCLAPSTP